MLAALTSLPVIGVPVPLKYLDGMDSLLSIVQMPKGIPVATFAIGDAGAANAGLFAVSILANHDVGLAAKLAEFRKKQTEKVFKKEKFEEIRKFVFNKPYQWLFINLPTQRIFKNFDEILDDEDNE